MPSFSCTVAKDIAPELRLDRYVSEYLKILSRSQIKARELAARLDGKEVKISRILKGGENLELSWAEAESPFLLPQNLPLDVVYEDARVIVLNKAQGMVVHPGAGNWRDTLANALLYRKLENERIIRAEHDNLLNSVKNCIHNNLQDEVHNSGHRPGIVHRLDKDTSGVIIAAWDDPALAFLAGQFKARKVRKSYAALVQGCPKEAQGCIEKNIVRSAKDRKTFTISDKDGRQSITYYKVLRCYGKYSLLFIRPKTGRTHQIRVHLKHLGCPILGDPVYGRPDLAFPKATLMLHAKSLSLVLPGDDKRRTFRTALPPRFQEIIEKLKIQF